MNQEKPISNQLVVGFIATVFAIGVVMGVLGDVIFNPCEECPVVCEPCPLDGHSVTEVKLYTGARTACYKKPDGDYICDAVEPIHNTFCIKLDQKDEEKPGGQD